MLLYHPTAKTTYVIGKEIHDNPENLTQVEFAEKFKVQCDGIDGCKMTKSRML